jgi:O-antigen/teichoic acid export membrane protein
MHLKNKALSIFWRDASLLFSNLLLGVLAARVLGASEFGVWVALLLVPVYVDALFRTKAEVASIFLIRNAMYKAGDVLLSLNIIAISSAIIACSLIVWKIEFINYLLFQNNNNISKLLLLSVLIPIEFLYLNYSYIYLAINDTRSHNYMVLIHAFSKLFFAIIFLNIFSLGIVGLICASIIGSSFALVYGWVLSYQRGLKSSGGNSFKICRALLSYGTGFYLAGFFGQFLEVSVKTIAVKFLSISEIGYLGIGQNFSQLLSKVSGAINTVLFPHVSGLDLSKGGELVCKAFRILVILLSSTVTILFLSLNTLINLVYGEQYYDVINVVHYLLPGIAIYCASSTLNNYFIGNGRNYILPIIQIPVIVVEIILAWFLCQWYGLIGASIALSIGFTIYGLLLIISFLIISKISFKKLIPKYADYKYINEVFTENFFRIMNKFR